MADAVAATAYFRGHREHFTLFINQDGIETQLNFDEQWRPGPFVLAALGSAVTSWVTSESQFLRAFVAHGDGKVRDHVWLCSYWSSGTLEVNGAGVAATSFVDGDAAIVRVYVRDGMNNVVERCLAGDEGWYVGPYPPNPAGEGGLAVVSWLADRQWHVRVYTSDGTNITEQAHDRDWYTGELAVPGKTVGATSWLDGSNQIRIRVYAGDGNRIIEHCWDGTSRRWYRGQFEANATRCERTLST
jgi:hypothetical protein